VKPESADYLNKARECLDGAKRIAELMPLNHIAAREAYLAVYHAAEAYIFDQTGKIAKTHRGMRSEFSRLAKNEPHIDRKFLTFLAEAYEYKSVADYSVGPTASPITKEDAKAAIDTAAQFIECVTLLLA
jgi:uncharacterized protein (UPF0332 family)